jgi:DNA-binding response OmpR family regulator
MPFNRILLAITDEGQRELYQESLIEEGFSVHGANNGNEALELFQIEGQDVIIADTALEGIGGISLLEQIHVMNPYCGKILVAPSGEDLSDKYETLKELGASEILWQPFNTITLLCAVENRVEKLEETEAAAAIQHPPSPEIKLRELDITIQEQRSRIRNLSRELGLREGLEDKLSNLRSLVKEKEMKLSSLADELNRSRDEMSSFVEDGERKVDIYQKTISGLMNENRDLLDIFEKKVIHHEKQLNLLSKDSENVTTAYEKKIAELETDLEMLKMHANELQESSTSSSSDIETLVKEQGEKLKAKEDFFQTELEELNKKIKEREKKIEKLEVELDSATSTLRELEVERSDISKEHGEQIAAVKIQQMEEISILKKKHIDELAEAKRELQPEKAKVKTLLSYQQTIIRNIFSAFLSVDHREKVTMANQMLANILGLSLGKLIGEKVSDIKELEAIYPYFKNALENNDEVDEADIEIKNKNQEKTLVKFRCKKVRFGQKDMCILLLNPIVKSIEVDEKTDKDSSDHSKADDSNKDSSIYEFGASVAADIVDIKQQLVELRQQAEKAYALTPQETALRESVNLMLNGIGDLINFSKSITDRAENILS